MFGTSSVSTFPRLVVQSTEDQVSMITADLEWLLSLGKNTEGKQGEGEQVQ